MNGYIFLYDTTYTYSAQSGLNNESITILLLGERIVTRRGEEPTSSRPINGSVLHESVIIGGQ